MPVICHKLKLVYFDMPKVASTSLKRCFWEIENNRSFALSREEQESLRSGGDAVISPRLIQNTEGYKTRSFTNAQAVPQRYETLVVLRDPCERLHSAWSSKVRPEIFEKRNETEDILNEGLEIMPSFSTFLEKFDHYRSVSRPARIHTHPFSWHLGSELGFYQHVFRLEDMATLVDFLAARLGKSVSLPRRNPSPPEVRSSQLSPAAKDKLEEITREDYRWLQGLYDYAD
jgi:hypothetical protein